MTPPLDQREREELCDLFLELGPDAPTLCEGWNALDLAAHLVIREREPVSGIGILIPRFAGLTRSRQERRAAQGFYSLVHRLRTPPLVPWRVPGLRTVINLGEYAVHHEDLRRANGRTRRTDRPDLEEAVWKTLRRSARLMTRKLDVGLDLALPDGRRTTAHAGDPVATLTGHPLELQLYLFGRGQQAEVDLTGPAEATTAVATSSFGI